jgi:hypothetical protein
MHPACSHVLKLTSQSPDFLVQKIREVGSLLVLCAYEITHLLKLLITKPGYQDQNPCALQLLFQSRRMNLNVDATIIVILKVEISEDLP